MIVDVNGDVIRKTHVKQGKVVHETSQDVSGYLKKNHELRTERTKNEQYSGNLVKAAEIPYVLVDAMAAGRCCTEGKKYKLLSPDPEESRRALMHIQECHSQYLSVDGNPFTKKRVTWE